MLRSLALMIGLGGVAVGLGAWGCGEVARGSVEKTFTSTVTLGGESKVLIEAWMPIEITADLSRDDIFVEFKGTVTASSSSKAQSLADGLDLTVTREGGLAIRLLQPAGGTVGGALRIVVPTRVQVDGRAQVGTISVRGLKSAVQAAGAAGTLVQDIEGDIVALATSGNVIVSTALTAGAGIRAEVGSGNVEIAVPASVSATIQARVGSQGEVLIQHPAFPTPFGPARTNYSASANGGLSGIVALTQAGSVIIRAR